jgi:eukaryotic-like serine/threonine-protein kinase
MGSAERSERSTDRPGPVADEVAVGTVIAGKYRLDARLGSGGMGTVWACTHLVLGDRMAVKVISSPTSLSEEVRSRFAREARATARLKSRFSVQVFDSGELPYGTPYIVMEYLQGETLRERLRHVSRLPLPETVEILTQVARGLKCAHEAGIIHRDIKPDNIFLAQSQDDGLVAKVFDFGVVKLLDAAHGSETVEGTFVGTPQFMSPEQARGQPDVDHRTDIYSLGVLAYRMLTGRPLFESSSIPALLLKICSGDLPKLRDSLPELPPDVEEWFQRTCARDRDVRYNSVIECVETLLVAAGMSSSKLLSPDSLSKLLLPDSLSSSGFRNYNSGSVRVRDVPREPSGLVATADRISPVDIEFPPVRRFDRWRIAALVICIFGVTVSLAIRQLHARQNAADPAAAPPHVLTPEQPGATAAPATASAPPVVATPAPLEALPSASASGAARTAVGRTANPFVQTPRPTTHPAVPKHADSAAPAAGNPQPAKSANTSITDVGY